MRRLLGLLEGWQTATSDVTRCRLHAVRFARTAESLRLLADLCDDASEKLDGDWILDRSYVAAFIQQSLARAREIVFDAGVLTGEGCEDLFARLDTVRAVTSRLTTEPEDDGPSAPGEEPECRMLRDAIRRLAPGRRAEPPSETGAAGVPGLGDVLEDALERAMASFEALHVKSWGRRTGTLVSGAGLPGPVRVVDAGDGVASAGGRARPPGREDLRSRPFLALVEPLDPAAALRTADPQGGALGILRRDRATVSVERPGLGILIDARLAGLDEANLVWCGLRSSSRRRVASAARVLTDRGFGCLDTGRVVTGWLAGRGEGQTREALASLGRAVAEWLRGAVDDHPHAGASRASRGANNMWASGGWGT